MKFSRAIVRTAGSLLLIIAASVSGYAQSQHQSAYNLALGGGGTAYVDNFNANFINPANLMLNRGIKPRFTLGVLGGLSTNVGGTLMNVGVYNKYFTKGLVITDEVADEALNDWFGADSDDARNLGVEFNLVPIGTSYRSDKWAASLAARTRMLVDMEMTRGMAELLLLGLDGDTFSNPRQVDLRARTHIFHELSVGYAREAIRLPNIIPFVRNMRLYVGVAPKLILGSFTSRMDFASTLQLQGSIPEYVDLVRHDFNYTFETVGGLSRDLIDFVEARAQQSTTPDIADYIDLREEDFYSPRSLSMGADLGATLEMDVQIPVLGAFFNGPKKLRVGLSVTDIGKVIYADEVGRFTADGLLDWQGLEFDEQRIEDEFNGDRDEYIQHVLQDSIGSNLYGGFVHEEGASSIKTSLPTKINLGAHLMLGRLSVMTDLSKGFNDLGSSSKRVSWSLGAEYRAFGFLPLRVGMRTGGYSSTALSAGTGLEFKNFEFSFAGSVVAKSYNYGWGAAMAWSGLIFRF